MKGVIALARQKNGALHLSRHVQGEMQRSSAKLDFKLLRTEFVLKQRHRQQVYKADTSQTVLPGYSPIKRYTNTLILNVR